MSSFPTFQTKPGGGFIGLAKPLGPATARVVERLDAFLDEMARHGAPVHGAYTLIDDRFCADRGRRRRLCKC